MAIAPSRVGSIILLTLLSCGCGGGSNETAEQKPASTSAPPPASAVKRDACSLITAEEVSKILGSGATATPRSTSGQKSSCDYVTKSFESFTLEAVWKDAESEIQSARSAATVATAAAGGKQDQAVNDAMGLYRVEKLGDEAYFSRRTMSYVRKGDVLLVFQNAGLNEPAREHWEALARAALARL